MDPAKANQHARLHVRKLIESLRQAGILPRDCDTQAAANYGVAGFAAALIAAEAEGFRRGRLEAGR